MRHMRLEMCAKLLVLMHSGFRTDAKAQAKALGVSLRSVFSYRKAIREARKLRFGSQVHGSKFKVQGSKSRGGSVRRGGRVQQGTPLPLVEVLPRRRESKGEGRRGSPRRAGGRGSGRAEAHGDHHNYLSRLMHCDQLLELEYSGHRSDVHELARKLGVSEVTIFRELRLIEEVTGRPLRLVRRRRKRTNL